MWIQIVYFQGNKVWMFESEETSKVMIIRPFDPLADIRVWSLKSQTHECNIVRTYAYMVMHCCVDGGQNVIKNKDKLPFKQFSRALWENL